MSFACNFCGRKFTTNQGLSSHYKVHKSLPPKTWLKHGPARSKIKTAFSRARREGRHRESRTRALSPVPLRAVKWVGPYCYELPWLTQGANASQSPLEGGSSAAAAPPSHFRVMDPIPGGLLARRGYGYGYDYGVPNGEGGAEESEETSSDFNTEDEEEEEEVDSSVE